MSSCDGLLCNGVDNPHSWSSASDEETNTDEWWDPLSNVDKTGASAKTKEPSTSSQVDESEATSASTTEKNWSFQCVQRVKRDMMAIYHDPPPGIFVMQDDQDLTVIHALITGSFDTPYEGGFFYFIVRCPPEYPIKPPKVKFMTTGGGRVRLNPNLYKNGKVCISILGTWSGPAWSPAHTLSSVLISIQSLLTEKPYHNEPGFERERCPGDSKRYNEIIQHETIRVAVCGMLDNDCSLAMPPPLVQAMNQSFLQLYEFYETVLTKNLHFTGCTMQDPFGDQRGKFEYNTLLERVQKIKKRLQSSEKADSTHSSSPDSD